MPQRELYAAHPGLDMHLVPRAEPGDEVADPEVDMVELEQEHQDQDDTGWLSDTTASCASTTSILKSDIIEAWKRRKKKNY
jgi:hypothetical protein